MRPFFFVTFFAASVAFASPQTRPATRPSTQPAADGREFRKAIATAIREHRLVAGMTVGEANDAMGKKGVRFSETPDGDGWAWPKMKTTNYGGGVEGGFSLRSGPGRVERRQAATVAAVFRGGKLLVFGECPAEISKDDLLEWQQEVLGKVKPDEFTIAIREHRIIKGMTVQQAERAMKVDRRLKVEKTDTDLGDDGREIQWDVFIQSLVPENPGWKIQRTVKANFDKSGRVVRAEDTKVKR